MFLALLAAAPCRARLCDARRIPVAILFVKSAVDRPREYQRTYDDIAVARVRGEADAVCSHGERRAIQELE